MKPLTPRQRETLDVIREYIEAKGYAPSYSELAGLLGISSPSTVYKLVHYLQVKGHISIDDTKHRSIQVIDPKDELRKLRAEIKRLRVQLAGKEYRF